MHFHCFSGDNILANNILRKFPNAKLGITGLIKYNSSKNLREVVKNFPLETFLCETDSPYFPPNSNDNISLPYNVFDVAVEIARIKNIEVQYVLQSNLDNSKIMYKRFFDE